MKKFLILTFLLLLLVVDFYPAKASASYLVYGVVFNDSNRNNVRDSGETETTNIMVTVVSDDKIISTHATHGNYFVAMKWSEANFEFRTTAGVLIAQVYVTMDGTMSKRLDIGVWQ